MQQTKLRDFALTWALPAFLFAWALFLVLHYGRYGMNPLDSEIIFDGAWRRYNGQQFFTDFITPNGFTPIWMQTQFFRMFGVTWFSYVLHAALLNGVFAVLVFRFLRKAGGNLWIAALFSALSALVFYPPMGTPYMDQHGFFFGFVALYLCIPPMRKMAPRMMYLRWALVPVFVLLAFLSKQNPAAFFSLFCVVTVMLFHPRTIWIKAALSMSAGLILCAAVLLFMFPVTSMNWTEFFYHVFTLPQQTGSNRMDMLHLSAHHWYKTLVFKPFHFLTRTDSIWVGSLYVLILLPLIRPVLKMLRKSPNVELPSHWKFILPALMLHFSSAEFIQLTQNQGENGIPFIFLFTGTLTILVLQLLKQFPPRFPQHSLMLRISAGILISMLLVKSTSEGYHFHRRVNVTRMVSDFTGDTLMQVAASLPFDDFRYLKLGTPYFYSSMNLSDAVGFFRKHEGNFFLYGDFNIIYPLTGRVSPSPYLWMHKGLTIPWGSDPRWPEYDQKLLEYMRKGNIRWMVFERPDFTNYMDIPMNHFEKFNSWVTSRKIAEHQAGGFIIWELSPESM